MCSNANSLVTIISANNDMLNDDVLKHYALSCKKSWDLASRPEFIRAGKYTSYELSK